MTTAGGVAAFEVEATRAVALVVEVVGPFLFLAFVELVELAMLKELLLLELLADLAVGATPRPYPAQASSSSSPSSTSR
jgi:hypothetical protein